MPHQVDICIDTNAADQVVLGCIMTSFEGRDGCPSTYISTYVPDLRAHPPAYAS